MRDKIVEILSEAGVGYVEKANTIRTTCPLCQREDKFSILKKNGSSRCYRASCEFGTRGFADWIAMHYGCTIREALSMLRSDSVNVDQIKREAFDFDVQEAGQDVAGLEPIKFPEFFMVGATSTEAAEGESYLKRRGLSTDTILKYDLQYSSFFRRVYFPVVMGGECYGWQGRHIDPVPEDMRMRNNDGFRRDSLVMFADNLEGSEYAVMAEGPFDALKFEQVGSNICTMGKVISDMQLDIVRDYGIRKLYLALDEDAAYAVNSIVSKNMFETYILHVPESCKARCAGAGKKADFGECTEEEATRAFESARRIDGTSVVFHVR